MNDSSRSRLIKLAHVASLVRQLRTVDGIGDFMQKSAYGYYQTPQQARTAAHVQQLVENKRKRHEERVANAPYVQAQKNLNHQRILDRRAAEQAAKNGDRALYDQYLMDEQAGKYIANSPYYAPGGIASQRASAVQAQQPSSAIQAQQQAQGTTGSQATSSSTPSGASLSAYKGNGEWDFPSDYTPEQIQEAKQMQQNVDEYSSAVEKYNEETGNPIQNVDLKPVKDENGDDTYELTGDAQTQWANGVMGEADSIAEGKPTAQMGGTTEQGLPEVDMSAGTGRTDAPTPVTGVTPSTAPQRQSAPTGPTKATASSARYGRTTGQWIQESRRQAEEGLRAFGEQVARATASTPSHGRSNPMTPPVAPPVRSYTNLGPYSPNYASPAQPVTPVNKPTTSAKPGATISPVSSAFQSTQAQRPTTGTPMSGSSMSAGGGNYTSTGPMYTNNGSINWNRRVTIPGITNKKKMNKPLPLE